MKAIACILSSILLTVSANAWTPPIGIPAPNWGSTIGNPIEYARPAPPTNWDHDIPGIYYVEDGGSNNGFGYPGNPRGYMLGDIPAGSIVYFDGTYTQSHSGGVIFRARGTSAQPIILTSYNLASKATATGSWVFQATSQYVIVDNINFDWSAKEFGGLIAAEPSTHHFCVRNGNVRSFGSETVDNDRHLTMFQFSGSDSWVNKVSDVVLSNLDASHGGDWMFNALDRAGNANDPDGHAIGIGRFTEDFWVVDCKISYTSGDAIQVGAGTGPSTPDVEVARRIYFGRNVVHHISQPGVGVKRSDNVIISENTFYGMRRDCPSTANSGGVGAQYGPRNLWIINNTFFDMQSGINIESGIGDPGGAADETDIYAVGNLFYNIHNTAGIQPDSQWRSSYLGAGACILWRGSRTLHVINNTFDDYDVGIVSPWVGGNMSVQGNIFTNRSAKPGGDFMAEKDPTTSGPQTFGNNIIQPIDEDGGGAGGPVIYWRCGGSPVTKIAGVNAAKGPGNTDVAPTYVNAASRKYQLATPLVGVNPAIDAFGSTAHAVYGLFQTTYERSIKVDRNGVARPFNNAWDIGAFEFNNGAGGSVPSMPTQPQGVRVKGGVQ